jgi:hypothetical protein
MRDPLNPFDDVDERVQGPFDEGDKITWADRNGLAHRLDGPAVEIKKTGQKIWALHGEEVSEKQVAAYQLKLEEEHERRLEAEQNRQTDAAAQQYHSGLEHDIEIKPPIKFKTLPKIWS